MKLGVLEIVAAYDVLYFHQFWSNYLCFFNTSNRSKSITLSFYKKIYRSSCETHFCKKLFYVLCSYPFSSTNFQIFFPVWESSPIFSNDIIWLAIPDALHLLHSCNFLFCGFSEEYIWLMLHLTYNRKWEDIAIVRTIKNVTTKKIIFCGMISLLYECHIFIGLCMHRLVFIQPI